MEHKLENAISEKLRYSRLLNWLLKLFLSVRALIVLLYLTLFKRKTFNEEMGASHFSKRGSLRVVKRYVPTAILGLVVLVMVVFALRAIAISKKSDASTTRTSQFLPKVLAEQSLNREFIFPIRDGKEAQIGTITYTIETAQLQKEIIVKGQRATAVKGRIFLILNIKIVNQDNRSIIVNARDYIRFSVNGSTEWLAADIHNDPVEAQAISTKFTRLGFPINESDKNYVLQVGEIKGQKTMISLNLK